MPRRSSQIAASKLPAPYTLPFAVPPVIDGRGGGVVRLEQIAKQVSILPGFQTTIFGYALPGQGPTTPGPTIHTQRGTPLTVMQANKLPSAHPFLNYDPWTSTHLHGSASKPQYDGYASDITKVGQTKRYVYPNKQDARTLWYHDHGVHHTAENAYMGLAAQYHLHDDVEKGLSIPKWMWDGRPATDQYDLPLILADKMFSSNGEFRYDDAGHTGLWGDVVLVNGVPWPNLKVKKRLYRFRILNASISRGYRLQLSNSVPISVIGTDGGLMPQVQQTTQLRIGMAERYEIVIDFSKYAPGTKLQLLNLGVPNSTDFDNTGKVMQFEVVNDAFDKTNNALPTGGLYSLNPNKEVWDLKETEIQGTTKIAVVRSNGEWKIQSSSTSTTSNSGKGSSGSGGSGSAARGRVRPAAAPPSCSPGRTSSPPSTGRRWPTRPRATSRSGRSRTAPAAGSTRCTSTSSTSRCSPATASRCSATSRAPRTSRSSGRTRRSGRSCGSARQATRPPTAGT